MIPDTKIALTLYNLREYCQAEADLDETLKKVAEIGYQAIQVSGTGAISPESVRAALDKHNLYCCATHENLEMYETRMDEVISKLKLWNCSFTALGYPGNSFWKPDGVIELAERLTKIGTRLADEGITFAYHNHFQEFVTYGKNTFLEELYSRTGYELFAELDVHWIQRGGADPALWIRKMAGRTSVLHFKDFAVNIDSDGKATPDFAEIGEGNINWSSVLSACEDTRVRWYVVEQDTPRPGKDIFESMRISYENMKKMGIE